MRLRRFLVLLLLPLPAMAQWPPTSTRNLKVLPPDMPIAALVDTMASFTRALGVRCTYCHVGREGDPLDQYDFASDARQAKQTAREMLRMVAAINGRHLDSLTARRQPRIAVSCATCHRGVREPRPIQQVLLTAFDSTGVDSTIALFRRLRTQYYGRAAYDFGDVPLADVAGALARRGWPQDAVRLHVLNVEFSPNSGFAHRQAAAGHLAVNDTASAIASLERALVINPGDQQATAGLARLRRR
jgi:hypothetical protein